MYISFVFHQKSANQVVKPIESDKDEEDEEYEDSGEGGSSQASSSIYED